MDKNVSDKKLKNTYCIGKWFSVFAVFFFLFYIAIEFIYEADFLADSITILPDDPYIYWIVGWILFVIAVLVFPFACVKFVIGCVQYYNSDEFKKIKTKYEAEE